MAVVCAAADLLGRRALELDLVLLIEGEEEAGSGGFGETVRKHKVGDYTFTSSERARNVFHLSIVEQEAIGHIDAILVRSVVIPTCSEVALIRF